MPRRRAQLSVREARRLAVGAQQFGEVRPSGKAPVGRSEVEGVVAALGAVQLDAINVVERSQFLVLFSRLGPYDRALLHQLTGPGGALWEYWGHAASLMPMADEPLLRWRRELGGTYVPGPKVQARMRAWEKAQASYLAAILEEVRDRGPLTAAQLTDPRRRTGEWWDRRSEGRQAMEWLFSKGQLAAWRTPAFERVYDLPERVIPAVVRSRPTPTVEEAHRALLMKAARASGVATLGDLAGYYMIQARPARARLAELVESGELEPVEVEGWTETAYLVPGARAKSPSRSHATLVSPFDSLVWDRDRTRRLFGFEYRLEVYVPEAKRVHGYYVLPLLMADRFIGRFDLKADRKGSVLRVAAAHVESGAHLAELMEMAAPELEALRGWLGLEAVSVSPRGGHT